MELWGYIRKSTESEERQVQSLDAQKEWIINYCDTNGHTLLGIIEESKTAKKPWREWFADLMNKFKKPKGQGIICWQLNRLARNPIDEWTIKWLVQQWIVKNIFTVDGVSDGSNILLMSVHFWMATQYVIDLSKNVKRWMKQKLEKWWVITRVPIGYYNDKNDSKAKIDEEYADYIKNIFELRIEWKTLKEIQKIMYAKGMRTRKTMREWVNKWGKEMRLQSIDKILKNPFYYWAIQHCNELYEGTHTPIIKKSLWDKVNNITRGIEYRTHHNMTPLKWKIKLMHNWEETNVKLTASKQKGHIYFHLSSDDSKKYWNLHISQKKIIEFFDELIIVKKLYSLPKEIKNQVKDGIYDYHKQKIEDNDKVKHKLQKEITKLECKKKWLITMRQNGELTSEEFMEEKNTIINNIVEINEEIQKMNIKDENIINEINNRLELLVCLSQSWKTFNENKKVHIISNICLELFVDSQKCLYIHENSFFKGVKFLNFPYGTGWEKRLEPYIKKGYKLCYNNYIDLQINYIDFQIPTFVVT